MMECVCIYSANIDDTADVLFAKWVSARKNHVCAECGEKIAAGESYYKEQTIFDEFHKTYKTCRDCKSIRDYLVCDFYYEFVREGVEETILDNYGNVPEGCLRRLTPKAREWVCETIERAWETLEETDKS